MGASLTWFYREDVFAWLLAPASGRLSPYDGLPIFTSPTEMLSSTIQLALVGGAVASVPMVALGALRLLLLLLPSSERRFLLLFFPAVLLFFLAGPAFAYVILLPTALNFLLGFGSGVAVATIRIADYMSLMTALMFWMGVVFELPLVMFLFVKLRLVSYTRFRRFRPYAPVAALVFSAIITPTGDVVNWLLVAAPVIALYEVGLFLAWLVRPDRPPSRCWRVARRTWSALVFVVGATLLPALLLGVVIALLRHVGAFE